jgi:Glycosyltransferase family 87
MDVKLSGVKANLLARRWFWVPVTLVVCLLLGPAFCKQLRQHELHDFVQEWASARNIFTGFAIYENQEITLRHHMGYQRRPNEFFLERNAHPPTSVLLAVPFAWLNYWDALTAWNLVSLALLGVTIWLILRELDLPRPAWLVFPIVTLVVICGVFGVLRSQLREGQLNLVLLLLVTGAWTSGRKGNTVTAGALVGAATAIKIFPGFLFLYFLFQRQWRSLASGVLSFLALTVLTAAILGPDAYRSYVYDILPTLDNFRSAWLGMSLRCYFSKLFDPYLPLNQVVPLHHDPLLARLAWMSCSALVVALAAWTVYRARSLQQRDNAFGVCLMAMLLVSPLTWEHYLLLLISPLVVLWTNLPAAPAWRWPLAMLTLLLFLHPYCYWYPLVCDPRQDWSRMTAQSWQVLTMLAVHTYALVGLFVLGLCVARRREDVPATQPQPRRDKRLGLAPVVVPAR